MWFTSDLHFGHANIIEYCNRPFDSVWEMNEWMVDAWNETVQPGDDVWVVGDVAMGNITRSLTYVSRLQGRLHLVVGNHDRPFRRTGEPKPRWEAAYRDAGFESIHHGTLEMSLNVSRLLVNHFPYVGDSREQDRFLEHRPIDSGAWLLHGHVHDTWRQRGRMVNVGVDAWAGRPVSAGTIATVIESGETCLDQLHWER